MSIRIHVDPTNPGQFFACCGLLELADRLWGFAEGWFEARAFQIKTEDAGASLSKLLEAARSIGLSENDGLPADQDEDKEDEDQRMTQDRLPLSLRFLSGSIGGRINQSSRGPVR